MILTDTRVGDLTSTPAPGDPNFVPYRLNSCAGGLPFGAVNFNQITGDFRLLNGTHTLTNNGYARFSYGQRPFTLGGPTQATASTAVGTVGAISANGGTPCDGEFCGVPTQNWFVNVLVRGNSQLDDAPTQFTYKTGVSGLLASARVLPANVPLGGYDVADVRLDLERPTVGVGRTLINTGQQPPGGTSTADGADGRSAALAKATRIPTVIQSFGLNDDGIDGDQEVKNAYWSRRIPDTDTPGTCLVDGMYKMHFTANFTKNGCTKRRELVRSTFVDVGVDATASGVTITPQTNAMRVNFCPKDRCGNQSGWGRKITCGPTPGCSCAASDIVDHGDGCYTVTVHTTPNASECTIDGTGSPIDVKTPVTASAGPDQILQCAGNGATAQLDGSGSSAASGTLSFLWTAPGITFSNPAIARPTARFPVGTTTVTLTVTSSTGGSATDNVLITVIDTAAPVIQVPPDITISTCVNANIGTATALDGCQGAVTVTNNRPTKFPLGTTVVTYFAVDRFGNASSATQRVTAVLGDDTSCCPTGTTIRVGTSNNDTLNGTAGSDCILGRGAQDTINGLGGNDFISGGEGNDIIDGGSGNDQLFGGNGQDQLSGGTGNDMLDGGGGDDQCFGGDNDDVLQGGQGQDRLFGENGNDQLFGDDGGRSARGWGWKRRAERGRIARRLHRGPGHRHLRPLPDGDPMRRSTMAVTGLAVGMMAVGTWAVVRSRGSPGRRGEGGDGGAGGPGRPRPGSGRRRRRLGRRRRSWRRKSQRRRSPAPRARGLPQGHGRGRRTHLAVGPRCRDAVKGRRSGQRHTRIRPASPADGAGVHGAALAPPPRPRQPVKGGPIALQNPRERAWLGDRSDDAHTAAAAWALERIEEKNTAQEVRLRMTVPWLAGRRRLARRRRSGRDHLDRRRRYEKRAPFNGLTPAGRASYLLPRGGEADGRGGEPPAGGGCAGAPLALLRPGAGGAGGLDRRHDDRPAADAAARPADLGQHRDRRSCCCWSRSTSATR